MPKRRFLEGYIRVPISLSPTWRDRLDAIARRFQTSRSNMVRRMTAALDAVPTEQLPEPVRNALEGKGEEEEEEE